VGGNFGKEKYFDITMDRTYEVKKFYDEATVRKLHGFIYSNRRVEYAWQGLSSIFNFTRPKRILEIGSGIGEICYRLATDYHNSEVVGFDISEQSIKIASDLFVASNLSCVRADRITEAKFSKKEKFDLIFLMDVYEHIPIDDRNELHQFISVNISENGFVFFSCPTPQHLEYLKTNKPIEIQPVDENITLEDLIYVSKKISLRLIQYKEVSVWRAADYFHAVFSNYPSLQSFSDFENKKVTPGVGLKREILRKIKPEKTENKRMILEQKNKIELIKNRLGTEMLEKVESFKL